MSHKGLLITFEGTEGAGKSTLIREVASKVTRDFGNVIIRLTREPGGSPIAEKIRRVILDDPIDPLAELFLYEAARAEHMAKTIVPALTSGEIVLCDRFTDSALAYQGHARGLSWKTVKALNQIATGGIEPDLTVLLDIDPALGLQRAREQTRFEAEGVAFQIKVRRGFLKARAENPKRWLTLKVASGNPEQLAEMVMTAVHRRFGRRLRDLERSSGS
ncbi:MAG TPA: dTMP kinase [Bdellovibrionota bacterium]|nr:dTMP kinase [Bdellovibrionota bacterium]